MIVVHLAVMGTNIAGSQRWPGVVLATLPLVYHGYGNWYALTHTSLMGHCGLRWNFDFELT